MGWTTGRTRFDPRQRRRDFSFSLYVENASGASPASCTIGIVAPFPGAKERPGMTLTTHPHLVPRSRMSTSYTPLPPSTFMTCNRAVFYAIKFYSENIHSNVSATGSQLCQHASLNANFIGSRTRVISYHRPHKRVQYAQNSTPRYRTLYYKSMIVQTSSLNHPKSHKLLHILTERCSNTNTQQLCYTQLHTS
jgi:hypothetical protein